MKIFTSFFCRKARKSCIILQSITQPVILENSITKVINQDFSQDTNALPATNVSIGYGNVNALKKLKSTLNANETNIFKEKCKSNDHKDSSETFRKFFPQISVGVIAMTVSKICQP